jgi:Predicted transcriptional regulators
MNIFGERLKILRIERKIPQKDIAVELNITIRTYQYYEAGRLEPNLLNLVKLAKFFNVTTDYLLGCVDEI